MQRLEPASTLGHEAGTAPGGSASEHLPGTGSGDLPGWPGTRPSSPCTAAATSTQSMLHTLILRIGVQSSPAAAPVLLVCIANQIWWYASGKDMQISAHIWLSSGHSRQQPIRSALWKACTAAEAAPPCVAPSHKSPHRCKPENRHTHMPGHSGYMFSNPKLSSLPIPST